MFSWRWSTAETSIAHFPSIFTKIMPSVAFLTDSSIPYQICSRLICLQVNELSQAIRFLLYSLRTFCRVSSLALPIHIITLNPVRVRPEKRLILLLRVIGSFASPPYMQYLLPGEEWQLISSLETEPAPRALQMESKPCSLTKAEYLSLSHQDMGSSFTPQNLSLCLSTDNVQQRDLLFLAPFVEHSAERRSSCCVDQSSFQSKRPIVFNHRDHTQRVHNSRRSRLQGDLIRNLENRHNVGFGELTPCSIRARKARSLPDQLLSCFSFSFDHSSGALEAWVAGEWRLHVMSTHESSVRWVDGRGFHLNEDFPLCC